MATERLGPVLAQLLQCANDALTTPVKIATIAPGSTVAWDDCCDGELWVRVVSVVGSPALSRPARQPCMPVYQVRVGIGVIRCAHVLDDQGNAPSAAEMAADAIQTFQDMADVVNGVVCCFIPMELVDNLLIEGWLPAGPQGGCVGGEVTLTFNHTLCPECEETP